MIPDPLHPAVVHFPLVLAVLLPISALWALWAIRRGFEARRAWALPLVLALLLTGTAWAALQTGEAEEERVEEVVAESVLHEHEEAAERFLALSGVVLLIGGVGLAGGTAGGAARILTGVGSVAVLAAGLETGAAGGELVYEHGAAQAYVTGSAETGRPALPTEAEGEGDEDGHGDDR